MRQLITLKTSRHDAFGIATYHETREGRKTPRKTYDVTYNGHSIASGFATLGDAKRTLRVRRERVAETGIVPFQQCASFLEN